MQKKSQLALHNGPKAVKREIPELSSIGPEEARAVQSVMKSGVLSKFLGTWHKDFYGGPKIKEFESAWKKYFGVDHAVSVNSCTSGLICALGAIGLEPGDEVIVSPWTMSATATAILVWNAIPIFADIETETFGLAPEAIAKAITPRTKAILVTDIFGHAARIEEIVQIARKHNLKVIEDVAQAPGARIKNRFVGLHADIGVFSLNYHKHIQTGEGGVCVTNDPVLCERMQLIRNHAESVVEKKGVSNLSNMIGFNFRMGEIEAAIGIEQLRKLKKVAQARQKAADYLSKGLRDLRGLRTPVVRPGCSHVYYIYPLLLDLNELPVGREAIAQMLKAEGIPGIIEGYVNVHRLPMYQKKIAYGSQGFPWKAGFYKGSASYEKGICPNAEELQDRSMMGLLFCAYRFNSDDLTMVIEAFRKVWRELDKAQ